MFRTESWLGTSKKGSKFNSEQQIKFTTQVQDLKKEDEQEGRRRRFDLREIVQARAYEAYPSYLMPAKISI
jgi:hypothetical protein